MRWHPGLSLPPTAEVVCCFCRAGCWAGLHSVVVVLLQVGAAWCCGMAVLLWDGGGDRVDDVAADDGEEAL